MKKSIKIIIVTLLILGFLSFIFWIVNSIWGNPISASIAGHKIKNYVQQTYPDMDVEISKVTYNFKFNTYQSQIQSNTSKDTRFRIEWYDGRIFDSYEIDVEGRYVTYERLSTEFSNKVEEIVRKEFPYETSILFADLSKTEINSDKLSLDMPFDVHQPPLPTALTIYILCNEISYDQLSARLLELYDIMNSYQIPIDLYNVVLEEPLQEGEKPAPGGEALYLYDFPVEKIASTDLIAVIKEHQIAYEAEHEK